MPRTEVFFAWRGEVRNLLWRREMNGLKWLRYNQDNAAQNDHCALSVAKSNKLEA